MFEDRFKMHHICYQHEVVKVVDTMMVDAWLSADPYFPKIRDLKLSQTVTDIRALISLSDERVTQEIRWSEDPNLSTAKDILRRITKRDFYR